MRQLTVENNFICVKCGKPGFRCVAHLKRNANNFCSRECSINYRFPNKRIGNTGNSGVPSSEYSKIHRNLRAKFGKATMCVNCGVVGKSKYEWALKKGCEYAPIIDNFMQLCCSCHRKYDDTQERRDKLKKSLYGLTNNIRGVKMVSLKENKEYLFHSVTEASRATGVSTVSLHSVLNGKRQNTKGYICQYQ